MEILLNNKNSKISGRCLTIDEVLYLGYSGAFVEFQFTGKKVHATMCSNSPDLESIFKAWIAVFIDDSNEPYKKIPLTDFEKNYLIYENEENISVKIKIMKISEAAFGKVGIKRIITDNNNPLIATAIKKRKIEFIGDSITCGYGIEGSFEIDSFTTDQENCYKAYAIKSAKELNAEYHLVAWSGIGTTSSWVDENTQEPLTDWLMPMLYSYTDASLCQTLKIPKDKWELWNFSQFQPDVIVINLGTNDNSYVRNTPIRIEKYEVDYLNFLNQVRKNNPYSTILATLGVMGQDLCKSVEKQVLEFRKTYNDDSIHFMPFDVQLEEDGIGTDWHPNEKTNIKMMLKLNEKIREIMGW